MSYVKNDGSITTAATENPMTNANALPIQVATDETVSMAHYNAAMDAKDARIDALEAALRPFVEALSQTNESFGIDVTEVYKTANCVSVLLEMDHFKAARAALVPQTDH